MSAWVRVASATDLPAGATLEVVAGSRIVALANVDGRIVAMDGVCPHQGGPLGKGELNGPILTCPWHGWQFDVCTGHNCLNGSIVQQMFPVRLEADAILVDLGDFT